MEKGWSMKQIESTYRDDKKNRDTLLLLELKVWNISLLKSKSCLGDLMVETVCKTQWIQFKSDLYFNPIGGGWISPHYFQTSISPWKKGSGGPKVGDIS